MYSPGEACEAARLLINAARPKKGGHRNYLPWHVFETLRILRSGPAGRPFLSRILGLGEASVKSMLSELERLGLIRRTRRGREATELGVKVFHILNKYIFIYEITASFFDREKAIMILVASTGPPRDLTQVYQVRDHLVAYGCRTALIGGSNGSTVLFPGVPDDIAASIGIPRKLPEGTIIIAPIECAAEAVSAGLSVLADSCPR